MPRPVRRLLLGAAASLLLYSLPAPADTGSDRFDEQIAAVGRALGFDLPVPADRARFMACGYVAPGLTAEGAPADGDRTFARMLERLRDLVRAFGEAPP